MDAIDSVVDPLRDFAKDSVRLVKRCHKPDRKGRSPRRTAPLRLGVRVVLVLPLRSDTDSSRSGFVRDAEFTKVATRTAIGFVVMGFVGFFVKLIFIPINNIIVGSG
jgi:protein transport protein SEC61 subunit gamma and related proteins